MKNILYVGRFELPDKNAAAHRVISNAKLMRDIGFTLYLCGVFQGKESKPQLKIENGIYNLSQRRPRSLFISILQAMWMPSSIRIMRSVKPRMVICYNPNLLEMIKWMLICRCFNIRIVIDCTEWYEMKGYSLQAILRNLESNLRMIVLNAQTDGIIAISKYLFEYYRNRVTTVLLPPLVDSREEKWNNASLKSKNDSAGKIDIIYAGSPGKGQKDRLDIMIKLLLHCKESGGPQFKFTVIGVEKGQAIEHFDLENEIARLEDSIEFIPHITHKEVIEYLKEADYSFLIREKCRLTDAGFPTKFVESISCGLPVITNVNSNVLDYIEDGETSIVIPDNIDEATKKIIVALDKGKSNIEIMKSNNLQRKTFDYRNYYDKAEEFLETIWPHQDI